MHNGERDLRSHIETTMGACVDLAEKTSPSPIEMPLYPLQNLRVTRYKEPGICANTPKLQVKPPSYAIELVLLPETFHGIHIISRIIH